MADLRDRVEEDRGLLKRIQLHVPGFAGYRRREDLRAADNMLRIQMADSLKAARRTTEAARQELVERSQLAELDTLGRLINRFQALEGKVRHADQGYSGISPAIRIEDAELNRLYEYDANLLDDAAALGTQAKELKASVGDGDALPDHAREMRGRLDTFEETFEKRMLTVSGTEVTE